MNGIILYKAISEKIIKDIISGVYVPNQSLPSHEDFCKKYDVGLVTIKKALKLCEDLGYVNCHRGRRAQVSLHALEHAVNNQKIMILDVVDRAETNQINRNSASIIPPICDEWHSQIKKGIIENIPKEQNVICATYYFDDILENYESTLLPEVDRVAIIIGSSPAIVSFLKEKGKTVVVLDSNPETKCCRIMNDEVNVSRSAVDYFISLGHKKIAFLGVTNQVGDFYSRQRGYQSALMDAGLPIDGKYVRLGKYSSADMGYKNMTDILHSSYAFGLPTAVFCADDIIAYGALQSIKDNLFDCPSDISIIGVNNYKEICNFSEPPLSSIEKNFRLIGEKFAEILMRKTWVEDVNIIECNIVLRKSISKNKKEILL